MRLLFDENLSEALVSALADLYPGSLHVRALGHGGASDSDVWALAAGEGCILVTRDEDFLQLSVVRGAPPKVVYTGAPSDGSAWESGNCGQRVVRGGSWDYEPELARVAGRNRVGPTNRYFTQGFRLARTL